MIKISPYRVFDSVNRHSYKDAKDFDPNNNLEKRLPKQLSSGYKVEDLVTYASIAVSKKGMADMNFVILNGMSMWWKRSNFEK